MRNSKAITAAAQSPEPALRRAGGSTLQIPGMDDSADLELIRWSLALHPEERLSTLQDFVDTFWTPRHG